MVSPIPTAPATPKPPGSDAPRPTHIINDALAADDLITGPNDGPSDGTASDILSGRDLVRPTHGTWLGVTRGGRISALTNVCEPGPDSMWGASRSRGEAPVMFLDCDQTTRQFMDETVSNDGMHGIGGLSLFCGDLSSGKEASGGDFGIICNGNKRHRIKHQYHITWKNEEDTFGVSNSEFGRNWPKVDIGAERLSKTIKEHTAAGGSAKDNDKKELVESLFEVMRYTDPSWPENDSDVVLHHFKNSVFIPPMELDEHIFDDMYKDDPVELAARKEAAEKAAAEAAATAAGATAPTLNTATNGHITREAAPTKIQIQVEKAQARDKRYGTKEQTCMIVDKQGHVTYVERMLHDGKRWLEADERDRWFEWDLEGWSK